MANVNFSPEAERPPLDRALEEAAVTAEARGRPLRVRCQPDLYNYEKGQYGAWDGLIWTVDLDDVEEGRRLREGLTRFFRLFGRSEASQGELLRGLEEMEEAL